jgi:hypothetical protein
MSRIHTSWASHRIPLLSLEYLHQRTVNQGLTDHIHDRCALGLTLSEPHSLGHMKCMHEKQAERVTDGSLLIFKSAT